MSCAESGCGTILRTVWVEPTPPDYRTQVENRLRYVGVVTLWVVCVVGVVGSVCCSRQCVVGVVGSVWCGRYGR